MSLPPPSLMETGLGDRLSGLLEPLDICKGGDMSKPPRISFLRPQLVTLWKRLTLRLSKMSVITVFTKMHCRRLVLDQVEQLGCEVGDDHVGSSSSHASCNLCE